MGYYWNSPKMLAGYVVCTIQHRISLERQTSKTTNCVCRGVCRVECDFKEEFSEIVTDPTCRKSQQTFKTFMHSYRYIILLRVWKRMNI